MIKKLFENIMKTLFLHQFLALLLAQKLPNTWKKISKYNQFSKRFVGDAMR